MSPAVADYATRREVETASKRRVAAAAAVLVAPGSTVILDGGTTTLAVTEALPRDLHATVVTHSPTVAAALVDHLDVEVFLLGGRLFRHSMVTCGAAAVEAAQAVTAEVFLLGVTGVHHEAGLTTGDADEAAMKRALARRAADTYVLASAEKVGAASCFPVLPLSAVSGVVTDAGARRPDRAAARRGRRAARRSGRRPRHARRPAPIRVVRARTSRGHRARRRRAMTLSVTTADPPSGPTARRSAASSRSVRHRPGSRSSASRVSAGVG